MKKSDLDGLLAYMEYGNWLVDILTHPEKTAALIELLAAIEKYRRVMKVEWKIK